MRPSTTLPGSSSQRTPAGRRLVRGFLVAALVVAPVAVVVAAPQAAVAAPVCVTNGTVVKGPFTVPSGVSSYTATLYGQAGSDWYVNDDVLSKGGRGMVMTGKVNVTAGEVLVIGTIPGARGGKHAPVYSPDGAGNQYGAYDVYPIGPNGGKGGDAQYVAKIVDGCAVPLLVSAGGGGAGGGKVDTIGGYGGAPDTVNGPQGGGDGGTNQPSQGGGGHGALSYHPCTINSGGCTGVGGTRGVAPISSECPNGSNGGDGAVLSGGVGADGTYDYGLLGQGRAKCTQYGLGGGGGGAGYYYGGGGGGGSVASASGGGGGGSPYAAAGEATITSSAEVGPHQWERQGNSEATPLSGGAILPAPIFTRVFDSTVTITSNKTPAAALGDEIAFTVTVTPNSPDFTIDGGSVLLSFGGTAANNTSYYPLTIPASSGGTRDPSASVSIPLSTLPLGSTTVTANYTGYVGSDQARSATGDITQVVKKAQSLAFTSTVPTSAKAGAATYTAAATATSGLTVAFSSTTPTTCTVAGATVTFTNPGTCKIAANQAGNGTTFAADQQTQSINVAAAGGQTITFTSHQQFDPLQTSQTYRPAATGGASNNPVTFSTGTQTNCSIDGTGKVTFTLGGDCVVYAHQDAGSGFSAGEASQTVHVAASPASVSITSTRPPSPSVGSNYDVVATANPGTNVTLSVSSSNDSCIKGPTTKVGNEWRAHLTFTKVGQCLIQAADPGQDPQYLGATTVQFVTSVGMPQFITFATHAGNLRYGGSGTTVLADNDSAGVDKFSTSTPDVCTNSNSSGTWTWVGVGTCSISVYRLGDDFYAASNTLTYDYTIAPRTLTVTPVQVGATSAGLLPTMKPTYTPFAFDDTAAALITGATCVPNTTTSTPAGTYPRIATCSGAASDKYTFDYQPGDVSLDQPPVTVRASDATKTYGAAAPTVTPSYSGLPDGVTSLPGVTCSANVTTTTAVGTYASTCSSTVDPGYNVTYVNGSSKVTKAPLTVTPVQTGTAVYGQVATTTTSYSGFVLNQGPGDLTTAPICVPNTTAATLPGTYPGKATCSGGSADNYALAYATGTVTIGSAPTTVTVTGSQTYGSTSPVFSAVTNVPGLTATSATCTKVSGATIDAALSAGSHALDASTCTATLSDPGYSATYAGQFTVAKKPVTVTASAGSMTYGGTLPVITASYDGFVTGQDGSALTTLPTCSANVTATTAAGTYAARSTCSGAAAANYSFTYPTNGAVTITPAPVTIAAVATTKVFGDADPTFANTTNGLLGNDQLSQNPTCVVAGVHKSVGGYPITCSGADAGANYTISYQPATLTVTRAHVLVTADNLSKAYGSSDPAYTSSTAGLLGTDRFTTDPTCSVSVIHQHVGSYPITCTGADAGANYTIDYNPGSLAITAKPITVTADSAAIVYGQSPPTFTSTVAGLKTGDTLTTPAVCGVAGAHTKAASYAITCSGANAGADYSIGYVPGTYTVAAKPGVVTADPRSIVFGAADPAFTATVSGLQQGDSLSTSPTCSVPGTHKNVGTYPIVCSGGSSGDYVLSYVAGTLTITKAPVQISADNKSKTFGAADPALTSTTAGLLGGDHLTTPATCTVPGAHANAGGYPIICSGADAGNNYSISYVVGTLIVGSSTQVISFTQPADAIFNGADVPLSATAPGGTVTFASTTPAVCSVVAGKARPLAAGLCTITASQVGNANYLAAAPVTRSLTVAKAAQSVTFTQPGNTVLEGADVPLSAAATSGLPVTFTSPTPGTCSIVNGRAHPTGAGTCTIVASQAGGSNYLAAAPVSRSLTVAKAPITVTTSSSSSLLSLLTLRVNYTSVVKSAKTGLPVPGISVTTRIDGGSVTSGCTAVTDAKGVATCTSGPIAIAIFTTFKAVAAESANYLGATATGRTPLL
ncbi:MAG: hypothetical protein JWQ74_1647 [Marmoricola sp.]|nr:hypothetical protein [Marmoricola sp.]